VAGSRKFSKMDRFIQPSFETWTEMRRLDHPQLPLAENAISGFPNRLRYPGNEQQLNFLYTAAASNIGGDETETKLFWDIF
jgi:hypothetical protein